MENQSTPQPETLAERAENTIKAKAATYGNPVSNMAEISRRWSITLQRMVTPDQVVRCLIDLKQARLSHTPDHTDSIVDIIGYSIILDMVGKDDVQNQLQRHQDQMDVELKRENARKSFGSDLRTNKIFGDDLRDSNFHIGQDVK